MLSQSEKKSITELVKTSLDQAERHWKNGAYELALSQESTTLDEATKKAESEPSKIPGHPIVQDQITIIDTYIALVADMRDSSKHLMSAISQKKSNVSGLQRVFYETSALLPAFAQTIKYQEGNVTEYLGDGVLALFKVDDKDKSKAIYASYNAANNIVKDTRNIINMELNRRYSLPALDFGVGLSLSKTLVTLIGLESEKHPKAFGECVFRATKLSSGKNQVYTDEHIRSIWPSSKGGKLKFSSKNFTTFKGYLVSCGE